MLRCLAGVDVDALGADLTPESRSALWVLYDGVLFVEPAATRAGNHPFPGHPLPTSTARAKRVAPESKSVRVLFPKFEPEVHNTSRS